MKTLFMMVGISGSGKSVFSEKLADAWNIPRFSSDEIRMEVCNGDATDQSKNGYVFKLLHERLEAALNTGSAIIDATSVKSRDRKDIAMIALRTRSKIVAVVMNTQFDDAVKFNSLRDRNVPLFVIEKQQNSFTVPSLSEVAEVHYVDWQSDVINCQLPNQLHFNYYTTEEYIKAYDQNQKA